jgi:hypothetical protein
MDLSTKKTIIEGIRCSECKHFAWEFARMDPVYLAGLTPANGYHHPSCPFVSPRSRPTIKGRAS